MSKRPVLLGAFSALAFGACATLPSGPSVMVLPGVPKDVRAVPRGRCAVSVLCSAGDRRANSHTNGGGQRHIECRRRHGHRCRGRSVDRCRRWRAGRRRRHRRGQRAAVGKRGRARCLREICLCPAEPLRHHLHTMHVHQGQPGAGLRSVSGCIFALSAPAAACSTRRKATASPTGRTAAASCTAAAQQSVTRILTP